MWNEKNKEKNEICIIKLQITRNTNQILQTLHSVCKVFTHFTYTIMYYTHKKHKNNQKHNMLFEYTESQLILCTIFSGLRMISKQNIFKPD